jgi:hypothetical protein
MVGYQSQGNVQQAVLEQPFMAATGARGRLLSGGLPRTACSRRADRIGEDPPSTHSERP